MNLLLLGLRASGKTTVGRLLADELAMSFVDLDDVALATFAQDSVRAVWAVHGEAAWREAEAASLAAVLAEDGQVIALGGGTPMIERAAAAMEASRESGRSRSVYLHAPPEILSARLRRAPGDRPSLLGDVSGEVAAIYAQRDPAYRTSSDVIVDVSTNPVERIVVVIANWLRGG